MDFNIMEFSNYEVTKGGIVYNRYHKPVRRKWLGDHIYVTLNDTNNKTDTLPISVVKQRCQLAGHDWKVFKQELQTCGVKEKRTNKARLLTNLELIKED